MKRCVVFGIGVLLLILVAGLIAVSQFDLSAIPEPRGFETYLATRAKLILVERSSRTGIPAAPTDVQASAAEGDILYGVECASCHGVTGRVPTDPGRWMYPRAADLGATSVQAYSNRELFWIVKNGLRFSGMPAFGMVETDEHIWNLVHYVRTLTVGKPAA